jgi:hypothetical protein
VTKFMTLWEVDRSKIPDSPEEQVQYWTTLLNMIKEDMKNGKTIGFGEFVGGFKGFVIREGTEQEIHMEISKYAKFTNHKTFSFLEVSELEEMLQSK